MQQALFEDVKLLDREPQPRREPAKRSRPAETAEPKRTLFGVIETKTQARKRAQEIVRLIGAVEDAPAAIECNHSHIHVLAYFIERSERAALDLNDLDGLTRMVGDTQHLLTERECLAMRKNEKIWRPSHLDGWAPGRDRCMRQHYTARKLRIFRDCKESCARRSRLLLKVHRTLKKTLKFSGI
jgi:hypothetical protein